MYIQSHFTKCRKIVFSKQIRLKALIQKYEKNKINLDFMAETVYRFVRILFKIQQVCASLAVQNKCSKHCFKTLLRSNKVKLMYF